MSNELFSLARPAGSNIGGGGGIKNMIVLIKEEDVASVPALNPSTDERDGDIVMKPGKSMHTMYMTHKTLNPTFSKTAGENLDCYGYTVSVAGYFPDWSSEFLKFMRRHGDFRGYVLLVNVNPGGSRRVYMIGEEGNPVSLSASESAWGKEVNEGRGTTITFSGVQAGPYTIYNGALSLDEPVVVAADAATVAYTPDKAHVLTAGTSSSAVIASITGMKHGEVILLQGAPGEYPAKVEASETFLLKESADWEATDGAYLTLRAFDMGSSTMVFTEVSRG